MRAGEIRDLDEQIAGEWARDCDLGEQNIEEWGDRRSACARTKPRPTTWEPTRKTSDESSEECEKTKTKPSWTTSTES